MFLSLSMNYLVSVLHSFLWLNNIPLYGYMATLLFIYLFIYQLVDIEIVSTFQLLWTILLLTFMYKFLHEHIFSILLVIHLGEELLGYRETVFNLLRNCQTDFQSGCIILPFHQQCLRVSISPHSHQHLLLSVFYYYSHPNEYETVSHCGCDLHILITKISSTFSCAYRPFWYLLWKQLSIPILCSLLVGLSFYYWLIRVLIQSR